MSTFTSDTELVRRMADRMLTGGASYDDVLSIGSRAHDGTPDPRKPKDRYEWIRAFDGNGEEDAGVPMRCVTCARESCAAAMPATRRAVLIRLALFGDFDGTSCRPSQRTLARATGLSQRVVWVHLVAAESAGWIARHDRGTSRGWHRHTYDLLVPTTPYTCDATTQSSHDTGATTQSSQHGARGDYSGARGDYPGSSDQTIDQQMHLGKDASRARTHARETATDDTELIDLEGL